MDQVFPPESQQLIRLCVAKQMGQSPLLSLTRAGDSWVSPHHSHGHKQRVCREIRATIVTNPGPEERVRVQRARRMKCRSTELAGCSHDMTCPEYKHGELSVPEIMVNIMLADLLIAKLDLTQGVGPPLYVPGDVESR